LKYVNNISQILIYNTFRNIILPNILVGIDPGSISLWYKKFYPKQVLTSLLH